MTTATEQAQKVIGNLEDELESRKGRAAILHKKHETLAYAAATGDKKARADIAALNVEITNNDNEIGVITSALTEANQRLATAQQAESSAADREQAEALRIKLSRFTELGLTLDDCIIDFIGAANEMSAVLNDIHALGCASPNANQMRVMGTIAIKTAVMQIPWTANEWEHLPPNQRKTFKTLVDGWRAMIEGNITARLGTKQEEAA